MPVITDRFVFLHIPKTGGSFIKSALAGIASLGVFENYELIGGHAIHPVRPDQLGDRPVIVGTRHPLSWLRSLWMHVQRSAGQVDFSPMPYARELLGDARGAQNVLRFYDRVLQRGPVVSTIFRTYREAYPGCQLFYVCRESLVWDLQMVLTCVGVLPHIDLMTDDVAQQTLRRDILDTLCMLEPSRGHIATNIPTMRPDLAQRLRKVDPEAFHPAYR